MPRTKLALISLLLLISTALAFQASQISNSHLINPDELVKILQSSKGEKPLLIHVGSHVLYSQAHIPGSEYIGPASDQANLQRLRARVEPLPRNKFIVIYCGCCPWKDCPNIRPSFLALRQMGFKNVKLLNIPNDFQQDWVSKGFPTMKSGFSKPARP